MESKLNVNNKIHCVTGKDGNKSEFLLGTSIEEAKVPTSFEQKVEPTIPEIEDVQVTSVGGNVTESVSDCVCQKVSISEPENYVIHPIQLQSSDTKTVQGEGTEEMPHTAEIISEQSAVDNSCNTFDEQGSETECLLSEPTEIITIGTRGEETFITAEAVNDKYLSDNRGNVAEISMEIVEPIELDLNDFGHIGGTAEKCKRVKLIYGDQMWPVTDIPSECHLDIKCDDLCRVSRVTDDQEIPNNNSRVTQSVATNIDIKNVNKDSDRETSEVPPNRDSGFKVIPSRVSDSSTVPSDSAPLPVGQHHIKCPASPKLSLSQPTVTASEQGCIKDTENTGLQKNPMAELNGHTSPALSRSFTDLPASLQQTLQQQRDKEELQKLRRESHVLRQELQQCKDTIQKLQHREKLLKERLSEQAQKQLKVSTKFEDLNLGDKRPTQLIRHYGNLYSEARLDAYDALDDLPEIKDFDDLKGKLLFSVIVLAFRSVSQSLSKSQTQLKHLLGLPEEEEDIPHSAPAQEVQDAIATYMMKTVDTHDLSTNMEEVSGQVFSTLFDYPSLKNCSGLKQYIEDCVKISWSLSVQKPTYVIKYDSPLFEDSIHTRFHASDPDSNIIKMVMWPSLLEGLQGPCVFKGVVLT